MMNGNPFKGLGYLIRGAGLILRPGIRRYVLIPFTINSILFSALIWFGASRFGYLMEWLLPSWLDWLEWLLWPLFALSIMIIIFFTFIHIAHLIGAPFNGLLAEAVERHLTGSQVGEGSGWKAALMNLWPALRSEMGKINYFIVRGLPFLILFMIPLVNIIAPFLWMAFTAWMLALEYSDYPMGNHGLLFTKQQVKLKARPLTVLGFGAGVMVLIIIPFVNFLAMPIAVAGATVMWLEEFSQEKT